MAPPTSVQFPPGSISAACERLNLSAREIIYELGIDAKTWKRWKDTDAVPAARLTDAVLLLELEKPADMPTAIPDLAWRYLDAARGATGDLEELLQRVERIEAFLDQAGYPDVPQSG